MNNDVTLYGASDAPLISRRAYNALCFGLVTASFAIMYLMYALVTGGALNDLFSSGTGAIVTLIVSIGGTIGGIVAMGSGKKSQSVGVSLAGYLVFSLTFGFTLALALEHYTGQTISSALGITACLAGIFLIAGVTFPEFFASIGRLLFLSLVGLIVAELIAVLVFHANQTIFDYITILVFCGFIGYDSLQLAVDDPTVPNAIWHASDIYIDIANILIRVLDILDNR